MTNLKKVLAIIISALILITALPLSAFAGGAGNVWDGTIATGFDSGTGSEEEPYIIKTAEQLAFFSNSVDSGIEYQGEFVRLDADIILNDTTDWESWGSYSDGDVLIAPANTWNPIGYSYYNFGGTFDGNGHSISGMYIYANTSYNGLFAKLEEGGVIKNLGIKDSYIYSDSSYVGSIVGYSEGYIKDCYNKGKISTLSSDVGGIVGYTEENIAGCYNTGSITGNDYVGGIVGELFDNSISITDCYNTGSITGGNYVGGIAGYAYAYEISNCYNTGGLNGEYEIGGIVGDGNSDLVINNCYNTGNAAGNYQVGGIVGWFSGTSINNCHNTGSMYGDYEIGGIAGHLGSNIKVNNCYNVGNITATEEYDIGGIAGSMSSSSTLINCYFLDTSVTPSEDFGDTALTAVQMTDKNSFDGFDFKSVWEMGYVAGYSYPTLRALGSKEYLYTLTFKNGQQILLSTDKAAGSSYTFETLTTNPGYSFAYWRDENYNKYKLGETLTVTENKVFTAVWQKANIEPDTWDGSVAEEFASGTGEENDPYVILTASQLAYLEKLVNEGESFSNDYFRLDADIKLNDSTLQLSEAIAGLNEWTSIGGQYIEVPGIVDSDSFYEASRNHSLWVYNGSGYEWLHTYNPLYSKYYFRSDFSGHFDGNGHTISGLYVCNNKDYQGLFGYTNQYDSIKNLGVKNSFVRGKSYVGGVAGDADEITNCYNAGTVIGAGIVGGVAGSAGMTNCYNLGTVISVPSSEAENQKYIGGVVGSTKSTLSGCYNTGTVTADGSLNVGGVAGYTNLAVSCYNIGTVVGVNVRRVGGVAGYGMAEKCYNAGTVSGSGEHTSVGGVLGSAEGEVKNCYNSGAVSGTGINVKVAGVVCESSYTDTVENCYNVGSLIATGEGRKTAGVTHSSASNKVINCYFLDSSAYISENTYGTALSATQMTKKAYFTGFNFNNVWEIGVEQGYSYPTLRDLGSKTYKYEFTFKNGSNTVKSLAYPKDSVHTFTAFISNPGYSFSYWRDENFNKYKVGDTLPATEDMVFTAVWHKENTEADVWDGSVAEGFESGAGDELDPYIIKTPAQLAYFAKSVNSGTRYENQFVKLDADIKLNDSTASFSDTISGENEWTAIGRFYGNFDGGGHTVSGVYINTATGYAGLFGYIDYEAKISNLTLKNSYIKSNGDNQYAGGIVSTAGDSAISNCFNYATVIAAGGYSSVGGIVGYANNYSSISDCGNYGTVGYSGDKEHGNYIGGIVGEIRNTEISGCFNNGTVYGIGIVGGIAGQINWSTIENSYNTGKITGKNYVGGIAGNINSNYYGCDILGCYNTGEITGECYIGGIVGDISGSDYTSNIENSYNAGIVSGENSVGGIVGQSSSDYLIIKGCYNQGVIEADVDCGGIIGRQHNGTYAETVNCYNVGNVKGKNYLGRVGGIAGYGDASYINCYNSGIIEGKKVVGGIVGDGSDSDISNCYNTGNIIGGESKTGGIVGYAGETVLNCYNIGTVTGDYYVGGIVGKEEYDTVCENCYYLSGSVIGNEYLSSLGTTLSYDEMKLQASFAGFDFAEVWTIDGAGEYPYPTLTGNVHHITYTVTFKDADGSVIATRNVTKGGTAYPPYMGDKTYTQGDYVYAFNNWDKEYENITSDTEIKAVYKQTTIIKFLGKEFDLGEVPNGYSAENLKVDLESHYDNVLLNTTNGFTMVSKTRFDMSGYNPSQSGKQTVTLTPVLTDSPYYAMAEGATIKVTFTVLSEGEDVTENGESDFIYSVEGDEVTITGYKGSATDVTIPATIEEKPVTAIGEGAFKEKNIRTVFIPSSVKSVGNEAFFGCSELITVIFSDGIEEIGEKAFAGCDLVSVTLPDTVTLLGEKAFGYNAELEKIGGFVLYGYAAAESYANAGEFEYSSIGLQSDSELGITAVVEDGYILSAAEVTEGLYYDIAANMAVDPSQIAVYNINLNSNDEAELQPNNVMKITLKIPAGGDAENLKVYRINSDGSVKDMKAVVEGENLVFYVSHLSYYAVMPAKAKYTPGDINGDGEVTLLDVSTLAQYVAEWQGLNLVEEALDVNGDGEVTLSDVSHLAQYVAEWQGIVLH